jgi:hypothetical protein
MEATSIAQEKLDEKEGGKREDGRVKGGEKLFLPDGESDPDPADENRIS